METQIYIFLYVFELKTDACETFKITIKNPLKNHLSTGQVLKNDFGISETVAQNINVWKKLIFRSQKVSGGYRAQQTSTSEIIEKTFNFIMLSYII